MTNTAMQAPSLAHEARRVSIAWRKLFLAIGRLTVALWAALYPRSAPSPVRSARQEAAKLRAYADQFYLTDPRYAQDLYAVATRHEQSATQH